jgi:hypothetical protein
LLSPNSDEATPAIRTDTAVADLANLGKDTIRKIEHIEQAAAPEIKALAAAGDLGRIERALTSQFLTLDTIFANLAERSSRQEYIKQMETFMRLALKAQAQARSTAEALALLKNPMPYIRQANIANGPQQVNNAGTQNTGTQQSTQKSVQQNKHAHAEKTETEPNKLLEANHGQRLDIGAQAAAGRANPHMATVEAVHRA